MSFEWLNRLSDRAILLVFFVGAIATSLGSLAVNLATEAKITDWGEGWLQNFSTELFGAFFGFWLLGMIVEKRREREAKQEAQENLKQRLIREIRSADNAIAVNAVEELRAYGWLQDGSLQGVSFYRANLQGVNLMDANLHFSRMQQANLQGANLILANLGETMLWNTNLQGANLFSANLQDSLIVDTMFDEKTTLPDDTKWTPDTDMTRFTDSEHPNFWRSDNPDSPAYQGKTEDGADE